MLIFTLITLVVVNENLLQNQCTALSGNGSPETCKKFKKLTTTTSRKRLFFTNFSLFYFKFQTNMNFLHRKHKVIQSTNDSSLRKDQEKSED